MSRGIEEVVEEGVENFAFDSFRCREVSRYKTKFRDKKFDRSTRCRVDIEKIEGFSIDPPGVETSVEIAIRKSLSSSTDDQVSRRCRGGVEPSVKNSFSRREKHRHECNPISTSTNDPLNI